MAGVGVAGQVMKFIVPSRWWSAHHPIQAAIPQVAIPQSAFRKRVSHSCLQKR